MLFIVLYKGTNISGSPVTFGSVLGVDYMTGFVVVDVAKLMEATGWTTIDGICFGTADNPSVATNALDEIYYTVGHDCASVCAECGKCLDPNCIASSCAAKCEGHVPPHVCEHVCAECGKCLDAECAEDACAAKCEGHVVNYDPSYLTQRDENSYYISNFDNASVMEGVTQEHINPWAGTSAVAGNTVAQGSYTNGHGTFTGITFQQPSDAATYGSFNYALPSAFDLSQAKTIVVRIAANAWSNGNFNSYIMLKSGSTYVNVNSYAKIYRGASMNGVTPDALSGSVISGSVGNYLTAYIEIDVAALMEATGLTSIDGIVFGANSKSYTHAVDEIYYTVPLEELKVEFTKDNTTAGQHTLEDTEEGLKLTGPAWAVTTSQFTLSNAVNLSEVSTITIRFKTNTGAVLVYWNEIIDSTYGNLNSPHTECLISSTVDEEGYTVLVLDAAKLAEKHAISELTGIHFKKNNAATIVYLDYVLFDFK